MVLKGSHIQIKLKRYVFFVIEIFREPVAYLPEKCLRFRVQKVDDSTYIRELLLR